MAHFDLQEQEQLSKLGYFWRDWGKYIIALLAIVIITYLSSVLWNYKSSKDASDAALLYANFIEATQKGQSNAKSAYLVVDKMKTDYPRAEYTTMASIWAAKLAYANKDVKRAKEYLDWVIKEAKDQGLVAIAMLRLADLYIEQKEFDKAISLLMQKHDASFDSLFYTKRGDLYLARGNYAKARDAYKEAINKAGNDQNMVSTIQLKLDVLGN